jgi:hypothetical protein
LLISLFNISSQQFTLNALSLNTRTYILEKVCGSALFPRGVFHNALPRLKANYLTI